LHHSRSRSGLGRQSHGSGSRLDRDRFGRIDRPWDSHGRGQNTPTRSCRTHQVNTQFNSHPIIGNHLVTYFFCVALLLGPGHTVGIMAKMKIFLLLALPLSILMMASYLAFGEELTLDRLFGSPNLSGPTPRGLKVSPDGTRVTYLEGKKTDVHQLDLWEFDIATKTRKVLVDSQEVLPKEILSEEEKSRRERQRIQDRGIVEYYWDTEGKAVIFPLGGDIYYKRLNGPIRRLTNSKEFETDIKVSPKGRYVSFIRDQNIFVIDLA